MNLHWFPGQFQIPRLAECLAGMANTDGGVVFLGISPRGKEILGVSDVGESTDSIFQAALMLEPPLVLPMPYMVRCDGKQVVVIQVPQGLPSMYSFNGQYLERVEGQTQVIPARRLRALLFERSEVDFDRQVPPGAEYDALDLQQVRIYIDALVKSNSTQAEQTFEPGREARFLVQRGVLRNEGDSLVPTYAGLLVFSSVPQQWLPSALILASRFPGTKFSDNYIKQEIRGSLPQQLQQVENFLKANLRTTVRIVGLTHREELEYPFEAVRELLVNAVVHRDYAVQGDTIHLQLFSDRLEVHSPGGLPGPVNLDNLLKSRFARNPVITQLMADLGFVERLGYGLDRVVNVMQEMNLPQPVFREEAGSFKVILKNNLFMQPEIIPISELALDPDLRLNPRQEVAIRYLHQYKRITNKDFQELCPEVHMETLRRDFADLVSQGVLLKVGDKRATYYILKEKKPRKK